MLVRHDEKVPIARLLTFLEHGERLANECAKAQAALASDSGSRHFLLSQARQEFAHGKIFQGVIVWLAPRHIGDAPFLPALEEYLQSSTMLWLGRICSKRFWVSRSFLKDWEKQS